MARRLMYPIGEWALALVLCALVVSCSKQSSREDSTATPGTTKNISFGRRQIDQMLADRPDMVGILRDDDPTLLWIIDGMNGERIGQRIYWNANSPRSGAPAEHGPPYEFYPPHICLSGGTEVTGIDKWACLVYELFNLENNEAFQELWTQALEGTLDREAYANECSKLEYIALKKAGDFFEEHSLPNTKSGQNPQYDQMQNVPATFEKYLAEYYDSNGNFHHPGKYFKDFYDEAVTPYINSQQQPEE